MKLRCVALLCCNNSIEHAKISKKALAKAGMYAALLTQGLSPGLINKKQIVFSQSAFCNENLLHI